MSEYMNRRGFLDPAAQARCPDCGTLLYTDTTQHAIGCGWETMQALQRRPLTPEEISARVGAVLGYWADEYMALRLKRLREALIFHRTAFVMTYPAYPKVGDTMRVRRPSRFVASAK